MRNIVEFLNENLSINEALGVKYMNKAQELMHNYFEKKGIVTWLLQSHATIEGSEAILQFVYNKKSFLGAAIEWESNGRSFDAKRVAFVKNAMEFITPGECHGTAEIVLTLNGCSLVKILPLIAMVLNKQISMHKEELWGRLPEFVGIDESEDDTVANVNEGELEDLQREKHRLYCRMKEAEKRGEDERAYELQQQHDKIKQQLLDLKVGIRQNVAITVNNEIDGLAAAEEELEERATPEERFKDMMAYIQMVDRGLKPLAVICGAPGVGKTYRITEYIEQHHTLGDNYCYINAKCTPIALFKYLFNFRHKGDIIIIDDCDDVMEDDTMVSLIKAATDSSKIRRVTYGTSKPPLMSDDEFEVLSPEDQDLCEMIMVGGKPQHTYPKQFEIYSGVIIITNLYAGSIDTAIRNRALMCNLDFNPEELLGIVKNLMPALDKTLSEESKWKALEYLQLMIKEGRNVQISIRSFLTCAMCYDVNGNDLASADRQIREQMRLQFMQKGKSKRY